MNIQISISCHIITALKRVFKVMSGIFHGHPILQLHRSESSFVLDSKVSTDVQCEKGTNYIAE